MYFDSSAVFCSAYRPSRELNSPFLAIIEHTTAEESYIFTRLIYPNSQTCRDVTLRPFFLCPPLIKASCIVIFILLSTHTFVPSDRLCPVCFAWPPEESPRADGSPMHRIFILLKDNLRTGTAHHSIWTVRGTQFHLRFLVCPQ